MCLLKEKLSRRLHALLLKLSSSKKTYTYLRNKFFSGNIRIRFAIRTPTLHIPSGWWEDQLEWSDKERREDKYSKTNLYCHWHHLVLTDMRD